MTMKSQWVRPQLIALGKGRPEEQVLNSCKVPSEGGSGSFPCSRHTVPDCLLNSKS